MIHRNQRLTAAVSVGVAAGLVLAGCSSSTPASSGKVTLSLEVPSYSDATKAGWESIIADFEKANPKVTINLDVESWDDIHDKVKTQVAGKKQPDILNIDAFSGYAADDLLYPAKDIASASTLNDIQTSFNKDSEVDGVQVALPFIASARALMINKKIFTAAGLTTAPTTWDELLTDAKAIKAKTGKIGYGMPLGKEEAVAELADWIYGAGGGYGDAKTLTIDSAANIEGATAMKSLITAGVTEANPGSTNRTDLTNVFNQGKIGMMVGLPPTYSAAQKAGLDVELGPIPTKDGSVSTLGVADHLMAFKGDAAKLPAIKKFIDYFYTDAVYEKWVKTENFLPVTKTAAASSTFANDPVLGPFAKLLSGAHFYPSQNPKWLATEGVILTTAGEIQSQSPATVLKSIQAKSDAGN